MILEVAHVTVLPGHEEAFERDLQAAVETALEGASGYRGFTGLGWGVERPLVYLFTIRWDTLADHMQGFRESERFTAWRALIGPHFDGLPAVEHFALPE